MSVPLTINGAIFNYPVNFDTNWGIDATGWAQAVTSGMLQKAGGTFTLTADVNFGGSFGLIAPYFTSHAVNPATSGTLRLASADPGVAFRNNANSANLFLTTDSSDNLVWSNHILLQNTNSLKFQDSGNAHTISVHAPAVATNYSLVVPPNGGLAGQVLSTDGTGTTAWINAAGTGTINSGTAGQITYYAANGTTVSGLADLTYNTATSQLRISPPGGGTKASLYLQSVGVNGPSDVILETNGEVIHLQGRNDGTFHIFDASQGNLEILAYNAPFTTPFLSTALPIHMSSQKISNLAAPTVANDALAYGHGFDVGSSKITGLIAATTSGDALAYGQSGWSLAGGAITGSLTSPLDMGSNKITSVATGTASQDAVNFGQLPAQTGTITNFTSYVPTFVGLGTVSSVNFYWRRVGDSMEITGSATTGTVTGSVVTISLAGGHAVASAASFSPSSGGEYAVCGEWAAAQNSTNTTLVLAAANETVIRLGSGSNTMHATTPATGTAAVLSATFFTVNARVPIAGWSI